MRDMYEIAHSTGAAAATELLQPSPVLGAGLPLPPATPPLEPRVTRAASLRAQGTPPPEPLPSPAPAPSPSKRGKNKGKAPVGSASSPQSIPPLAVATTLPLDDVRTALQAKKGDPIVLADNLNAVTSLLRALQLQVDDLRTTHASQHNRLTTLVHDATQLTNNVHRTMRTAQNQLIQQIDGRFLLLYEDHNDLYARHLELRQQLLTSPTAPQRPSPPAPMASAMSGAANAGDRPARPPTVYTLPSSLPPANTDVEASRPPKRPRFEPMAGLSGEQNGSGVPPPTVYSAPILTSESNQRPPVATSPNNDHRTPPRGNRGRGRASDNAATEVCLQHMTWSSHNLRNQLRDVLRTHRRPLLGYMQQIKDLRVHGSSMTLLFKDYAPAKDFIREWGADGGHPEYTEMTARLAELYERSNLSVLTWNIHGNLMVKLRDAEFVDFISHYDVIMLQETHHSADGEDLLHIPPGYDLYSLPRPYMPFATVGGGVCTLICSTLGLHVERRSDLEASDFLVLQTPNLYIVNVYVPPENSPWYDHLRVPSLDHLSDVLLRCLADDTRLAIVSGDFNARLATRSPSPCWPRKSPDSTTTSVNTHGRTLLASCVDAQMAVVNANGKCNSRLYTCLGATHAPPIRERAYSPATPSPLGPCSAQSASSPSSHR
ncbi:hypothetical protein K474DRAFT_1705549 [Panus rudis PR-1116 ss-1]|nr:hypothetical protein K474DRAFT_1705549 [Panus rudis PR-1116 ss-1]